MNEPAVIINGTLTTQNVSFAKDRGFLLGDAVFETIHLYGGKAFMVHEHLARLRNGASVLDIPVPFSDEQIIDGISLLRDKKSITEGKARLTLTRGTGGRGYNLPQKQTPLWLLDITGFEPVADPIRFGGITLATISTPKCRANILWQIKSTSSAEKIVALMEAQKKGADEGVLFTDNKNVSSVVAGNIFWVNNNKLFTPSNECAILPGVTRSAVLHIAKKLSVEYEEVDGGRLSDLFVADEVFITNSMVELMPVRSIDGGAVQKVAGNIFRKLFAGYKKQIANLSRRA